MELGPNRAHLEKAGKATAPSLQRGADSPVPSPATPPPPPLQLALRHNMRLGLAKQVATDGANEALQYSAGSTLESRPQGTMHRNFGLLHGELESENQLGRGSAKRARLSLPEARWGGPDPGRGRNGSPRRPWGSSLVGQPGTRGSWESRSSGFLGLPDIDGHVSHRERPGSRPGLWQQREVEARGHSAGGRGMQRHETTAKSSQLLSFSAEAPLLPFSSFHHLPSPSTFSIPASRLGGLDGGRGRCWPPDGQGGPNITHAFRGKLPDTVTSLTFHVQVTPAPWLI